MNTNHTKGQWSFTSDGIFDGNNDQIASLLKNEQQYFKSRGENLVNAKLIAAAPELLEALTNLLEDAEFDRHIENESQFGLSKETAELIEKARLSIEKATK